jgi:hypothetical protein
VALPPCECRIGQHHCHDLPTGLIKAPVETAITRLISAQTADIVRRLVGRRRAGIRFSRGSLGLRQHGKFS